MKEFEKTKEYTYEFGFEESYGCLIGDHARDKDGIVAVMMLCEAAAYYKKKGLTLWDQMINIYKKYGYYKEGIASITLKGAEGSIQIKNMLNKLRENPLNNIGTYKVIGIRDYLKDENKNIKTGKITPCGLPQSNVLYYELENDAWCCIRPSGTEPKVKFYMGVKANSEKEAEEQLKNLEKSILEQVK